jgi:phage terminase large subunit-like protein
MAEHRQGYLSMNEPSKALERLVLTKALRHGGQACLRWMASNVSIATDPAGNIKPVKPDARAAAKIDGIVSAVMAIGASILGENDGKRHGPSIYETRGALIL